MGRRNQNSEFYKEDGAAQLFGINERQLKEGYSYEGGPDMVARGSVSVNKRVGAGRDGISYKQEERTVYSKETKPKAAAAAPAPAPPKPKPKPKKEQPKVDPSNYVQARRPSANRSGANFNKESTLNERKELTNSFSQKKSYDPDAGVSSPEAGDFLNNYKIDVKKNINSLRSST